MVKKPFQKKVKKETEPQCIVKQLLYSCLTNTPDKQEGFL